MVSLRIIITGGTFDKSYNPLEGSLSFSRTHLPEIMKLTGITLPYKLEINQLKDSLEMNDHDRLSILESAASSKEKSIIIIHGTDTMVETARVLAEFKERLKGKTVILTGAMIPYSISGSDSLFNLGAAVMASQLAEPGIHIVMNGRLFPHDRVEKNKSKGIFELR